MRHRISSEVSNLLLKNSFANLEQPLSVTRVGLGGETLVTYALKMGSQIPDQWKYWLHNNAGFYGSSDYEQYAKLYSETLLDSDMHAYWQTGNIFEEAENLLVPEDVTLIDPSSLESFRFAEPWTVSLKDKKVLVIHPFKSSIDGQWKRKESIWKNPDVLNFGELITYQSVQSIGGIGPHSSWFESLKIMMDDISGIDFDVALLGCGSYGIPLLGWIKSELKKSGVYVGGGLQLYFGIRGQRWDRSPDVSCFYNDSWIRCTEQEKPRHINMAGDEASYF
jgi:hypothetical protein